MKHYLGLHEFNLRQRNTETPVFFEPARLINAHCLFAGQSGSGKSFQFARALGAAAEGGYEIDVFDVHDELQVVKGSRAVMYSQATGYGYNPLRLDTDIHVGGVNRQADFLLKLVRGVTPQFGPKQEHALRNLIVDTYAVNGIFADNPRSWQRRNIDEATRANLIDARSWSELRHYYPTLDDLRSLARRKVVALAIGGDNKSVSAFEQLQRLKSRLHTAQTKLKKSCEDDEIKRLESQINDLKDKCIETYTTFVQASNGKELDEILKFDSVDVLTSVIQRLETLNSAGIFRPNEPPFGSARVRVHQIKSLTREQQVLFVKLRMQEIFERRKAQGPTASGTEVRHIVALDEADRYFCEDPEDIVNIIAKESRKFGIGLWCATQNPTAFPMDFLTNCGANILLGIAPAFWKKAASMLRIDEQALTWVRPKEVIAVKLQVEGVADPRFTNVLVPNPNSEGGRRALRTVSRPNARDALAPQSS